MKLITFLLLLAVSFSSFAQIFKSKKNDRTQARPDPIVDVVEDLSIKVSPKKYLKRNDPVVKVALIYYGEYYSEEDLLRVSELLTPRFEEATKGLLRMETVFTKILPFKHKIADYPDYKQEYVTDIERLQRLWYYDNKGAKVINEVYGQVQKELKHIDVLLVVTGAQFDALGFASGRVAITENPMEIAWGLPNGGRVEYVTDERVVDELLHEMGHTLFLDHASSQCFRPGMEYKDSLKCCESSPAKDDVMSYCRSRDKVKGDFYYKFSECNIKNIKDKIIPAMLSGGDWAIKDRYKCD